eukprot:877327_1
MKTSIAALSLAAILTASSVSAHEAMLGGDETTNNKRERRLGWYKKDKNYYRSLWYRCCNTSIGVAGDASKGNEDWRIDGYLDAGLNLSENDYCKCPVRGSNKKGLFSSQTYFDKWTKSCAEDGSIYTKAEF